MTPEEIAAMKAENEKLKADLLAAKPPEPPPKPKDPPQDDPTLADKARLEREAKEKAAKGEKSMESAMRFNMGGAAFLKDNIGLIPKNIESIFAAAEKENYGSQVEKANEIKVGVISEFFAVQANHDLLTVSQKSELDDFLKLTKNGKQERAESIYAMIFEPALETLRKVEKAKQLNTGTKNQTDSEKVLAEKMMKASRSHYLGDKA